MGGFGRVGACFSTTFAVFELLGFPSVFAAFKSVFLPTVDFLGSGCGGWVADLRF